jgi:hypothetical protein
MRLSPKAQELVRNAIKVYDEKEWCRNSLAVSRDGYTTPLEAENTHAVCLLGALTLASGLSPDHFINSEDFIAIREALVGDADTIVNRNCGLKDKEDAVAFLRDALSKR